ncbi:DNA replication terminus site-binding protein [Catenovulum adriaticum]|uniref:DNA replication terminus site-binding protein n=1 Tax=Catenovulum adriaticum TaxID=2984846 RepID=A0ABY7ASI4_9ALTE|nr:DNA replication terminus site-binding protein [Catenovulum sp. TS8]WAJ72483.1 DNA replication terminus site-binding protein [Catenovulum sp. TS8]
MSVQIQHIIECQNKFRELTQKIKQLNQYLQQNHEYIKAYCYQIGQLNPTQKTSPIIQSAGLDLSKAAYLHFKLDAGDIVKHVVRYPGLISINHPDVFTQIEEKLVTINKLKTELSEYISRYGKPNEFKTTKGDLQYVRNDLIYKALPMVNHGMLKRHIVSYSEPMLNASFGWNVDFNHETIDDIDAYKTKLHGRMNHPPDLTSAQEWQLSIETVLNKIDRLVDAGILLKNIRPKPVEPKMYVAFEQRKITIRPRLPIIALGHGEHVNLKTELKTPKPHPLQIKNSSKFDYQRLSPFLYLYACRKK